MNYFELPGHIKKWRGCPCRNSSNLFSVTMMLRTKYSSGERMTKSSVLFVFCIEFVKLAEIQLESVKHQLKLLKDFFVNNQQHQIDICVNCHFGYLKSHSLKHYEEKKHQIVIYNNYFVPKCYLNIRLLI